MKGKKEMTYSGVGVKYEAMDPFKQQAQLAGRKTANNLSRFGFSEVEASRGESAYLVELPNCFIGIVEEGLGTKNLVADAMYWLTDKSHYDQISQCCIAMIVNDMITVGALPFAIAMHLAVGNSSWFDDERRYQDLIEGWKRGCNLARSAWGCGETPTLKGIVNPETVLLSGSSIGVVKPKKRFISEKNIQDGDAIVLFESSGIHANGLTLAREIAGKLHGGYLTKLSDGRTYGEALLDPTIIYVPVIEDCLNTGVKIHYAVNITGHGWRKLMRAVEPFVYVIEHIPEPQPVFSFIQENGPVDNREMYGNFNMGAGFAVYVQESDVEKVISIAKQNSIRAFQAGYIRQKGKEKKVIIQPMELEYLGSTLSVR